MSRVFNRNVRKTRKMSIAGASIKGFTVLDKHMGPAQCSFILAQPGRCNKRYFGPGTMGWLARVDLYCPCDVAVESSKLS